MPTKRICGYVNLCCAIRGITIRLHRNGRSHPSVLNTPSLRYCKAVFKRPIHIPFIFLGNYNNLVFVTIWGGLKSTCWSLCELIVEAAKEAFPKKSYDVHSSWQHCIWKRGIWKPQWNGARDTKTLLESFTTKKVWFAQSSWWRW